MKKNEREIEFTKNFANKKKGDVVVLDSMLASGLVHRDKVAEYTADEHKENSDNFKAAEKKAKDALAKTEKAEKKALKDAEELKEAEALKTKEAEEKLAEELKAAEELKVLEAKEAAEELKVLEAAEKLEAEKKAKEGANKVKEALKLATEEEAAKKAAAKKAAAKKAAAKK